MKLERIDRYVPVGEIRQNQIEGRILELKILSSESVPKTWTIDGKQ